jgi:2-dehydro-3-deoxy-D-gluconate 5-dehydrogenase
MALALAQAGAHVILVHRSPSTPTDNLDAIRSQGYPASVVYADLADKAQVKALYPSALETLKADTANQRTRIEIIVHAAGIQRRAPAAEFKDDEWEEVSCPLLPYITPLHRAFIGYVKKESDVHILPR